VAIPKQLYDLRKKFDPNLRFVFGNALIGTNWVHYKGGFYFVTGIVWDSTADEWAIKYVRPNGGAMEYTRTITDWYSKPLVGDDTPRYRLATEKDHEKNERKL
jgi:hypothetical protein